MSSGSRKMGETEALIAAINVGNVAKAKSLINSFSKKKLEDFGGVDLATPLYYAAKTGNMELVEMLVMKGCDLDSGSMRSRLTAFMIAAQGGHLYVMQYLLESGCNQHLKDNEGRNALYIAVDAGDLYITKFLVQEAQVHVNDRNNEGKTPFFRAVELYHHSIAEVLTSRKADISACDDRGYSPLMLACEKGLASMAKILIHELLMCGQAHYINDVDRKRRSALYLAVKNKHFEIVESLIRAGANVSITRSMESKMPFTGDNPVLEAISLGNIELLRQFTSAKSFDVNQTFHNQKVTPIHWAVLLLCKKEADKNTTTFLTTSTGPPDTAYIQVIQELLHFKPDLNIIDNDYHTALHTAASYGLLYLVKLLLQHGADINSRCQHYLRLVDGGRYFFKPIDCALLHGHFEVLKYFVTAGAYFTLQDWQKVPELHVKLDEQKHLTEWIQVHRK